MTRHSLFALTLVCLSAGSAAAATDAKLTGFDVLARKDRTCNLVAKLERKGMMGIDPDVKGESLDFFIVGKDGVDLKKPYFLGTGKTNDDGLASIDWKPDKAGRFACQARVRKGSEYTASPAEIFVAVPAKKRPILLVQIDGSVSTVTNAKMFRGTKNEDLPAAEGAKQMLSLLAQHHQLVYLTDLEVAFAPKFKEWLGMKGIPPAPVFFWEIFERSLSHKTYLSALIKRLRKGFPEVRVGIGGSTEDGEAFSENGLVGVVIAEEHDAEMSDTVVRAKTWQHAFAHVLQSHRAAALLKKLAAGGKERPNHRAALSLLGDAGIGYLHPYTDDADLSLASAAVMISNKLRASKTFFDKLDRSSAARARNSLVAAWRYGEPGVVQRLYVDHDAYKKQPMPKGVDTLKLVSRNEPEPGKVVYKVTIMDDAGKPNELEIHCVEQDDKTWKIGNPTEDDE